MENIAASSTDYSPAQRRCPKRWVLWMLIAVEESLAREASLHFFKSVVACVAVVAICGCDRSQPTPPVTTNPTPVELPESTNSIGMQFKLIPAGDFLMGSPQTEAGRDEDESQHRVRITKPFYAGVHEVTVGQFKLFVAATSYKTDAETDGKGGLGYENATGFTQDVKYSWRNSGFPQGDDHPVLNVSWNDAVAFCSWLTRTEGVEYRLPTEAEWEYACRAGTTTTYHHGNDPEGLAAVGNVSDRSLQKYFPDATMISANDGFVSTSPVGRFRANGFGLYDMHGNVWEWCSDWYGEDYYDSSPTSNPTGPSAGSRRVFRSGNWFSTAAFCRSANRGRNSPSKRIIGLGFRVARSSDN